MEDFDQVLTPDTNNPVNKSLLVKSNIEFEHESEIRSKRRLRDSYGK